MFACPSCFLSMVILLETRAAPEQSRELPVFFSPNVEAADGAAVVAARVSGPGDLSVSIPGAGLPPTVVFLEPFVPRRRCAVAFVGAAVDPFGPAGE